MDKLPNPILNHNLNTAGHKQTVRITLTSHHGALCYADLNGDVHKVENKSVVVDAYGGVVSAGSSDIITFKGNPVMMGPRTWVFAKDGEEIISSPEEDFE